MPQATHKAFLTPGTPYGTVVVQRVHHDHQWIRDHTRGWQCGEPGMIDAILSVIGEGGRRVCEFGAGNMSDTTLLCVNLTNKGWDTFLIEADQKAYGQLCEATKASPNVTAINAIVRDIPGETIEDILAAHGWSMPDVLVVDIDGAEWYVVNSMKSMPRVLVVEHRDANDPYNPPLPSVPRREDCGTHFDATVRVLQANAPALDALLKDRMVCVAETQFNSIYVSVEDAEKLRRPGVRLNIGAGASIMPGYVPVEIKVGSDARTLDYPDNSVDEVYASHILEHFSRKDGDAVMKEWARVLKPGGIMRIAVPNVRFLADKINDANEDKVLAVLYGGQDDKYDQHFEGYTPESLRRLMNKHGIGYVEPFDAIAADCSRLELSLNLEGRKRNWSTKKDPKVAWVMTQGRLCFTEHTWCMVELAHKMKFGVIPCRGPFWDRDIEVSTMNAIDSDAEYFMFTDYDGIFAPEDAATLIERINADPTIGAIICQQMSRHDDRPLVFEPDIDYTKPMVDVRFGHFGLTIVRREVFEEMPRPWFWSIPGVDSGGGLGHEYANRSDADITFWRNMTECGFRIVQCNDVVIGHMVECVKWPRNSGTGVQLQPMQHYRMKGRPPTATINRDLYVNKGKPKVSVKEEVPASPMHAIPRETSGALAHQHDQG